MSAIIHLWVHATRPAKQYKDVFDVGCTKVHAWPLSGTDTSSLYAVIKKSTKLNNISPLINGTNLNLDYLIKLMLKFLFYTLK